MDGFRPGEKQRCGQQCQQPRWILWLRESGQALPQPITSSRILPEVSLSSSYQRHSPAMFSVFCGPLLQALLPGSDAPLCTAPSLPFLNSGGSAVHAHIFMQVQDRTLQDLKVICSLSTQAI